MSAHPDDFEPGIEPAEQAAFLALGERLVANRPLPSPAFRGELQRKLHKQRAPRGLRLRAVSCLVSGVALLLVAALGVADSGPLAPQDVPGVSASVDQSR